MAFSHNLKRLRLARGMTQEQLALACGWPGQSRVGNYESDGPHGREPKLTELPVIAAALGVSISELFDEPDATALESRHGDTERTSTPVEAGTGIIDPYLLARTHAFLVSDRPYDLGVLDDVALFAKAYAWLAQNDGAADSPGEFNKFLRWAAVRDPPVLNHPTSQPLKGNPAMSNWRGRIAGYGAAEEELVQKLSHEPKLSTK